MLNHYHKDNINQSLTRGSDANFFYDYFLLGYLMKELTSYYYIIYNDKSQTSSSRVQQVNLTRHSSQSFSQEVNVLPRGWSVMWSDYACCQGDVWCMTKSVYISWGDI